MWINVYAIMMNRLQLPHPFDRPNQIAAYDLLHQSGKKFIVLKLPTGSGKSAIVAKNACDSHKTLVAVQTKSLQQQYDSGYSFISITGKGDYECYGIGQQASFFDEDTLSADLCLCPKELRSECVKQCPYPIQRQAFIESIAGVTNYAKFLRDRSLIVSGDFVPGFDPEYLFLDEAHELSDLVVDFSGLSLSWKDKRLMKYCSPLSVSIEETMEETGYPEPIARDEVLGITFGWLSNLYRQMKSNSPKHPSEGGDIKLFRWHKNTMEKVDIVLAASEIEPDCWFVHTDDNGITIRPLTARFHFKRLFDRSDKIVLMSATVSPKDILALGINFEEAEMIDLPNPIPVGDRPIHLLRTPNITWKSTREEKEIHARIISDNINETPKEWITMVHFPSKNKAQEWSVHIQHCTRRPVYVPDVSLSTNAAYDAWLEFKDYHKGAICCAWQFWTGIDAGYVNTNIIADMPYPNFGDMFQKVRFDYNPGEARSRVANAVEQGMGRNRRGFDDHYGPGAKKLNIICNSSKFQRLRSAFSKDFLESIR